MTAATSNPSPNHDETRSTGTANDTIPPRPANPRAIAWLRNATTRAASSNDNAPATRHIVRFGGHPGYRTKARVPYDLRGKLPSIIGRGQNPPDLAKLSQVLRIGGAAATPTKKAA